MAKAAAKSRQAEEAAENSQGSEEYGAKSIQVLGGMEAVRKRPAMYIGDISTRGLHHLVYEVVDNSVDEALGGHCDSIQVVIHSNNSISVTDNGRGIPVDIHKTEKKPAVEVVLTVLHAGGKFDKKSYKVSGGLHGVGVSCVNALSEWLEVEVRRDGKTYHMRFERGKTASKLTTVGKSKSSGTTVTFKADKEIFNVPIDYSFDILSNRLRELAFLNKGLSITLKDERGKEEKEVEFKFAGGIVTFVQELNKSKATLNPKVIYFEKDKDGVHVEIAMQYNDGYSENIFSYVNNINTTEGGTHVSGFKAALTRCVNQYCKEKKLLKDDITVQGDDIREGIAVVISCKVPNPQFEGQTKTKLGNSEVEGIVESTVNEGLGKFFEENSSVANKIIEKRCSPPRRAKPPAKPATSRAAKERSIRVRFPASSPTARRMTPRFAKCISSRVIRQAVPPSRAATASSKPFFPSKERSSMSNARVCTRSSRTTKFAPSSMRWAPASGKTSILRSSAIIRSSSCATPTSTAAISVP